MSGPRPAGATAGLCAACRHRREVGNKRGSVFVLCTRSATDRRFPRYPTLPVLRCDGYEVERGGEDRAPREGPRFGP